MGRRILRCLTAFALIAGACAPSVALTTDPQDISGALPDNLRKPLAAFLEATGWKEGERLASTTRYWQILDQVFLLRVTAAATCDEQKDLCLTIVGSLRNGGFVSEAVFFAGSKVQILPNAHPIITRDGPILFQIRFFGRKQGVSIFPAPTGWIILPSPIEDQKN